MIDMYKTYLYIYVTINCVVMDNVISVKVRLITILILSALFLSFTSYNKEGAKAPIKHDLWNNVLSKVVSDKGNVDYEELVKKSSEFNQYLELLRLNHPESNWNKNERLAYWINAYNAFTIELIINNFPVKSIMNIKDGEMSAWDIKFIKIEGRTYSLNDIEHNILRKKFNEPRIHFGVNCASYSCPRLLNKAFTSDNIDSQLNILTKEFVNDTKHNIITNQKIEVSQIFNWFKEDFTKTGTLIEYLNKYSKVKISPDAEVKFIEYNWSLNN